ncbi:hypothetical protein ACTXGQ_08430 [Marinobacter sp. 1Y8]
MATSVIQLAANALEGVVKEWPAKVEWQQRPCSGSFSFRTARRVVVAKRLISRDIQEPCGSPKLKLRLQMREPKSFYNILVAVAYGLDTAAVTSTGYFVSQHLSGNGR